MIPGNGQQHEMEMGGLRPRLSDGTQPFFECPLCPEEFALESSLEEHLSHHRSHQVTCVTSQSSSRTVCVQRSGGLTFSRCKISHRLFADRTSQLQHIQLHAGKRPYKCSQCTKSFTDKDNLLVHMQSHNRLKTYKCSHCQRSFTWKSHLDRHMSIHSGVKPYKCNQCQKSFGQKCTLGRHTRIHTGEKSFQLIPVENLSHTISLASCADKYILERNLTSVSSVQNPFIPGVTGKSTKWAYGDEAPQM